MNITQFTKKNLIVLTAILISLGTMSFKWTVKQGGLNWYVVMYDDVSLSPYGESAPPLGCNLIGPNVCAIQMDIFPGNVVPATIDQAYYMAGLGLVTIYEQRYRE